jgi:hypothetical protein
MAVGSPIVTQQIQIVDEEGRVRILLSAATGSPAISLTSPDGKRTLQVQLDSQGRPTVKLDNPDPTGPTAALEVDDKGAHVKFNQAGGASSYVFLNNAGQSGVVLIDSQGVRRINVILGPEGEPLIERFGQGGAKLP